MPGVRCHGKESKLENGNSKIGPIEEPKLENGNSKVRFAVILIPPCGRRIWLPRSSTCVPFPKWYNTPTMGLGKKEE